MTRQRNLIGAQQLALMKPTAFLINHGPRRELSMKRPCINALRTARIAGAAIDVYRPGAADAAAIRWPKFDNVLLAPHCIAWTEELFSDIGKAVCQEWPIWRAGEKPRGMVNPAVLQRPGFKKKWSGGEGEFECRNPNVEGNPKFKITKRRKQRLRRLFVALNF